MWDDVIIGSGNRGSSACHVFAIKGDPDGSQVTFNLKKEYSYSQTTTLYKRVN